MHHAIVEGALGRPLACAGLSHADRQIAAAAMFELPALCAHVAVYAGPLRAINAQAVVDEMLVASGIARSARMHPVRLTDDSRSDDCAGGSRTPYTMDDMAADLMAVTPAALTLDGWEVRYARDRIPRADSRDWAASWQALEVDRGSRVVEHQRPNS